MTLSDIKQRCAAGEIVIVESINEQFPDEFIAKNPEEFAGLTIEYDFVENGIVWIYDKNVRKNTQYNPEKNHVCTNKNAKATPKKKNVSRARVD